MILRAKYIDLDKQNYKLEVFYFFSQTLVLYSILYDWNDSQYHNVLNAFQYPYSHIN